MAAMMKQMAGKSIGDRLKSIQQMGKGGMLNPGAMLSKAKVGTGKRLTADDRNKLQKQREKEARRRKRDGKGKKAGSPPPPRKSLSRPAFHPPPPPTNTFHHKAHHRLI